MDGQATGGIVRFFRELPDPRRHNVIHKLDDILVIAICAVICGADGWVEVELFGNSKLTWFKNFLNLPNGIPSHDTFDRVFARLDPDSLERCFMNWTRAVAGGGRLIAIDGKSIRRSFEHGWDRSGMAHLVSAFVDENHLVFGQCATTGKGKEIEAIDGLLELLDLKGATVTIDAMGCQKNIAGKIVERGGDYVLAVKDNQRTLHAKVKALLDEAILENFRNVSHDHFQSTDGGHGRIETRNVWICNEVKWLGKQLLAEWPKLAGIVAVECQRECIGGPPETRQSSTERRYFITSCSNASAESMAQAIRGHWSIENKLHWQLDVSFNEDQRRIRTGHGAENFSRLCRISLNLLKADKTTKAGIHGRRLKAGWDEPYLLRLLTT
jgi:predicted transposase YbfD/YdcC